MNRLSVQQLNALANHAVSRFPDDPFADDICAVVAEVLLLRAALRILNCGSGDEACPTEAGRRFLASLGDVS